MTRIFSPSLATRSPIACSARNAAEPEPMPIVWPSRTIPATFAATCNLASRLVISVGQRRMADANRSLIEVL